MTSELRQDRPSKPVIYFRARFWRVTHMPKGVAKGRNNTSRQPWIDAHKLVTKLNLNCTVAKKKVDDVKLLTTSDLVLIKLRDNVRRYVHAQNAIVNWPFSSGSVPDSLFADEQRCLAEVEAALQAADNYVIGELNN